MYKQQFIHNVKGDRSKTTKNGFTSTFRRCDVRYYHLFM